MILNFDNRIDRKIFCELLPGYCIDCKQLQVTLDATKQNYVQWKNKKFAITYRTYRTFGGFGGQFDQFSYSSAPMTNSLCLGLRSENCRVGLASWRLGLTPETLRVWPSWGGGSVRFWSFPIFGLQSKACNKHGQASSNLLSTHYISMAA